MVKAFEKTKLGIFQTLQKWFAFAVVGDYPRTHQNSFRLRNLSIFLLLVIGSILSASLLLVQAKTFQDYSKAFYPTATAVSNTVNFMIIAWKIPKIVELIDNFEDAIKIRKLIHFVNFPNCVHSLSDKLYLFLMTFNHFCFNYFFISILFVAR